MAQVALYFVVLFLPAVGGGLVFGLDGRPAIMKDEGWLYFFFVLDFCVDRLSKSLHALSEICHGLFSQSRAKKNGAVARDP